MHVQYTLINNLKNARLQIRAYRALIVYWKVYREVKLSSKMKVRRSKSTYTHHAIYQERLCDRSTYATLYTSISIQLQRQWYTFTSHYIYCEVHNKLRHLSTQSLYLFCTYTYTAPTNTPKCIADFVYILWLFFYILVT